MTPHELNLHIHAYTDRMKVDAEERITMAYLMASWSRADKLPSLKSILQKVEQSGKPKQAKTTEQLIAFAQKMHEDFMSRSGEENESNDL
ncbi:hypothetical protein [Paenibacillus sedimenti]|uniref:Uncharacterized protein n=1 Tax=Paenibacillus sedimenti TaxID=2770274 RepID=A0A926QK15_9BACL|nr:hypothetical protein [Paenibacillus sedimenti]MBD0381283.1 hypothetical protein [Paenibacillus sedimenti]